MKERPILFSGPMVRAILAGTKTQTRRALREGTWLDPKLGVIRMCSVAPGVTGFQEVDCPYGRPGDKLWVKETFAKVDGQTQPWIATDYRATYKPGDRMGDLLGIKKRWTPSIHMPRVASRITLEITEVRVERLQDISEADANAEGCRHSFNLPAGRSARENFEHLWWTINGDESWDANPWVWVLSFKQVGAAQ